MYICWLSEPDHVRAQNNLKYFEQQVEEQKQAAHRQGKEVDEEAELINYKPYDDYKSSEEFQTYEALCRGESPIVRNLPDLCSKSKTSNKILSICYKNMDAKKSGLAKKAVFVQYI